MLERLLHADSSFLTLTYSDENLPRLPSGLSTLEPRDVQLWLKRIRKVSPVPLRFYLVGEYGDDTQRPHYHCALFGWPPCIHGNSSYSKERNSCCPFCDQVRDTWGLGQIFVGHLSIQSAQYVAGYVTKKMTDARDPRLNGRHPEFCRMSLRPGIGHDALHEIASVMMEYALDERSDDVPSSLQHGKKLLPLGRYLRRRLRELLGRDPKTPEAALARFTEELRDLFESSRVAPTPEARALVFKNSLIDADSQRVAAMESRQLIFKQRKVL